MVVVVVVWVVILEKTQFPILSLIASIVLFEGWTKFSYFKSFKLNMKKYIPVTNHLTTFNCLGCNIPQIEKQKRKTECFHIPMLTGCFIYVCVP